MFIFFGHTAFDHFFWSLRGLPKYRVFSVSSLGSIGYRIRVFQRSMRTSMLEYGYIEKILVSYGYPPICMQIWPVYGHIRTQFPFIQHGVPQRDVRAHIRHMHQKTVYTA